MKIGIVPKIIEIYKNQFEISVETKLITFLKKCFKKSHIYILGEKKKNNFLDLIILSGGNDLFKISNKKKDKLREEIDNFYFKKFKGKIPIIGICYGAQFLINKNKTKFYKSSSHVGSHKIYFSNFLKIKKLKVLSHHKYIFNKVNNEYIFAKSDDGSIEGFFKKEDRISGIIWHPERQNNIKINTYIFKKVYETINIGIRTRNKIKK